jgi:hypothetical protein
MNPGTPPAAAVSLAPGVGVSDGTKSASTARRFASGLPRPTDPRASRPRGTPPAPLVPLTASTSRRPRPYQATFSRAHSAVATTPRGSAAWPRDAPPTLLRPTAAVCWGR